MIRRPPRSTQSRSSAASDVYKRQLVEHAGIGVGAGTDHGVDRIGAPHRRIFAFGALWPGMVEVERKRDHLALLDQLGGGDDVLRRGVIERADFVGGAPFAPVLVFLRGGAKVLTGDFLGCCLLYTSDAADDLLCVD